MPCNGHFGCVHWTEADVEQAIEEVAGKLEVTDENVQRVLSSYAARHIADRMIELGWEILHTAVREEVGGIVK